MLIKDDLYQRVRRLAFEQHRTATSVVEEALVLLLKAQEAAVAPPRFHTFSSALVDPAIDLNSNAAVADYLDDTDPDFSYRMASGHADA